MASRIKGMGKAGMGKMGSFCDDFKAFIMRGNVVDLAVGVIIGAAFGLIIKSLVADIFTPIISLMGPGNVLEEVFVVLRWGEGNKNKTAYDTRAQAKADGSITMNYGNFIQTIINFVIVALCLFLFIKLIMCFKRKEEEEEEAPSTDWPCPKCMETVKEGATRCPHCAAEPIHPPPKEEEEDGTTDENNPDIPLTKVA